MDAYQVHRAAEEWLKETGVSQACSRAVTLRGPRKANPGEITISLKPPSEMDSEVVQRVAYENGAVDMLQILLTEWMEQRGLGRDNITMLQIYYKALELAG